jgi:hypothetical protein
VWEGKAKEEIELEEKGLSTDLSDGVVCKKIHEEPFDAGGCADFLVGAANDDGDVSQMGWEDDDEGGGLMDLLPCQRSSNNDSNKCHRSDSIESDCSLPFVGHPLPLKLLDTSLALKVTVKRILQKRKRKFARVPQEVVTKSHTILIELTNFLSLSLLILSLLRL